MANAAIGEINLSVGNREFTLKPSFNGLAEIESRADCGILNIANEISQGKIKLKHIVAIVYGGIVGATPKGQKPEITFEELGDLIVGNNYPTIVTQVVLFFGKAIVGDPEAQKKTP